MADGLNISTKAGEGQANILNWGDFHNTLNRLYERDIQDQTAIKNQFQKSEMQLLETAKGLRPTDIPKFKQLADDYKQASLMLMSPKVKKDPQQTAFWKSQQQDSYINAVSHAERSKETQKSLHDMATMYAQKKGIGMLHPEDWNKQWDAANGMTSDEISQTGLNVPTKWMRPMVNFPKQDFLNFTLGKEVKDKVVKQNPNDPTKEDVYEVRKRENSPHQIALNVLKSFDAAPDTYDYHKQVFENLVEKGDIATIKNTVEEANKLDPSFPLQYDAAHYAAADLMLQAKPNEVLSETRFKKQAPLTEEQKFESYKKRAYYAAGLRVKTAEKIKNLALGESGNRLLNIQENAIKSGKLIPIPELGDTLHETKEVPELLKKYSKQVGTDDKGKAVKAVPDGAGFDKDGNLRIVYKERNARGRVISDKIASYDIIPLDKVAESIYVPEKKAASISSMIRGALRPQKKSYKGLDKDGNPIFE